MLVITITALLILLVCWARDGAYSTNANGTFRNDNINDMLRDILQRMVKIENHVNTISSDINTMQRQMDRLQRQIDQMETKTNIGFGQIENDNRNVTMVMETIVEQQMVITAEIFTVSQTLPFCCCHYQNTPGPEKPDTTTATPLKSLPRNCDEAMGKSGSDGVYKVNITNFDIGPFEVYCMKMTKEDKVDGTWMIIQRRQDNTTDFYRNWNMYKHGFGDLKRNFWIGLDKIHALTKSTEHELWVHLEDRDSITAWAKYSHFSIGNEDELYELKTVGQYVGTAGDSLTRQKENLWSTYDRDNDQDVNANCAAVNRKGGWWNSLCGDSNLNGIYDNSNNDSNGILWYHFRGWYHSMKYAHMAIRPTT